MSDHHPTNILNTSEYIIQISVAEFDRLLRNVRHDLQTKTFSW